MPTPQHQQPAASSLRWLVWLSDLQRSVLALLFGIAGPRASYAFMSICGRALYRLLDPLRILSEAQVRGALTDTVTPERAAQIAEQAFLHRLRNLADLLLARRYLRKPKPHVAGCIPAQQVERIKRVQASGQPLILLTAYYGSYDLLPIFLGHHGIKAHVLYREHPNANYDRLRQQARAIGGCSFIPTGDAVGALPGLLEQGETIAIVGDHHGGKNDIPVHFLGLPTRAIKSVALLACQYNAGIVVAGLRRVERRFEFEVDVGDIFGPEAWRDAEDPQRFITERYLHALEKIILRDPEQYLWAQPRWGGETAKKLVEGFQTENE